MRQLLILLIPLLWLPACKKNDTLPKQEPAIRFTANGIFYQWNVSLNESVEKGALLIPLITPPPNAVNCYDFHIWSKPDRINFYVYLEKTPLTTGDYISHSAAVTGLTKGGFILNDIIYIASYQDDFIKVTITKIENRKASGTFSAVLHEINGTTVVNNKMEITNGSFENVTISD